MSGDNVGGFDWGCGSYPGIDNLKQERNFDMNQDTEKAKIVNVGPATLTDAFHAMCGDYAWRVETRIYGWADNMVTGLGNESLPPRDWCPYNGGWWETVVPIDQPSMGLCISYRRLKGSADITTARVTNPGLQRDVDLSLDAMGLVATLCALNAECWQAHATGDDDLCNYWAERQNALQGWAMEHHPEAAAIAIAID